MPETHIFDRWANSEHLAEYARQASAYLTRDEAQAVFEEWAAKQVRPDEPNGAKGLMAVWRVASKVKDLVHRAQGNLAHWAFDGIRVVADYEPQKCLDKTHALVMAAVRESIEREIAEDMDEGDDAWWTEEKIASVRAWLDQTPYELWQKVDEVEEYARESLDEYLLPMARAEDKGECVARDVRERWEQIVTEWAARREAA